MPKGKKGGKADCATLVFHYVNNFSLTAGANSLVVAPAMSPRANTEADAWSWYRVKALKFRIFALTTAAYAGFVEGSPDTIPASGANIMELLASVQHNGPIETMWSRWITVSAKSLAGALPWYKTIPGTNTQEEEIAGVLCFAGTGTNAIAAEYYVTFEFKGPIATANTPAMVDLLRRVHAERVKAAASKRREALLADLGTVARSSTPT